MKRFFLERVSQSPIIKCSGHGKEGVYVVYEDAVEFLETGRVIRLNCLVEWVVSGDNVLYAITGTGIFLIKEMNILDKLEVDLKNITVKEAWHRNDRIFMRTESEIVVYTVKDHKLLRYAPYGHQIIDVSVDYSDGSEFILLLTSHDQRIIRTIRVSDGLEEIAQVSVSKNVYRVFGIEQKKFLCVESSRLLLHADNEIQTMCFGGPLVRAGCILSDGVCLLSMLTDELCEVDISEFIIKKYIPTDGIIAEHIVGTEAGIYMYNTRGDIGIIGAGGVTHIRRGYLVSKVKISNEYETTPIYLLKQTAEGNVITKLNKRVKREKKEKRVLVDGVDSADGPAPMEIGGDESILFVKYQKILKIVYNTEDVPVINVHAQALACNVHEGAVQFITRSGVICKYFNGHFLKYCIFCDFHENEIATKSNVEIDHTHEGSNEVVLAHIHADTVVYSTEEGVHTWNYTSFTGRYLGKYSFVVSLIAAPTQLVIGQEAETSIIDMQSHAEHKLKVAGRAIIPINEKDYVLQKYDGSLCCVIGHKTYSVCTGSVIIKNVSYVSKYVIINTQSSTLQMYIDEMGIVHAEYIENIGGEGIACRTQKDNLLIYEDGGVSYYTLLDGNEYVSSSTVYDEDVLDFLPVDDCMLVVTGRNRRIDPDTLSLETETDVDVKMHRGTEKFNELSYSSVHYVSIVKAKNRIVLGVNTKDGFMLALISIQYDECKLMEVSRISVEEASILSMDSTSCGVYCNTSHGLMVYQVKKSHLELTSTNVKASTAQYNVEGSYLVETNLSRIKLYEIDSKISVSTTPTVYIDRMKNKSKTFNVFDDELSLLGYSHEKNGSFCILKKQDQYMNKIMSVILYAGIVDIKSVSMDLIKRADCLLILTDTGSIYMIARIADEILSEIGKDNPQVSEMLKNEIVLFSSEMSLVVESSTAQEVFVCNSQFIMDKVSSLV